jgi:hypothetical protein
MYSLMNKKTKIKKNEKLRTRFNNIQQKRT